MLELQTAVNINLIQVYAPTDDCDKDVLDQFYEKLERVLEQIKCSEITILMEIWIPR